MVINRVLDILEQQQRISMETLEYLKRQDSKPDSDSVQAFAQMMMDRANLGVVDVSSGRPLESVQVDIYTSERIVEKGKEYTRLSHPLLFSVVDYLESNHDARALGVRVIADKYTKETGQSVSKSWAAVAKNYWQSAR